MRDALASTAASMTARPTAPRPKTATVEPGSTCVGSEAGRGRVSGMAHRQRGRLFERGCRGAGRRALAVLKTAPQPVDTPQPRRHTCGRPGRGGGECSEAAAVASGAAGCPGGEGVGHAAQTHLVQGGLLVDLRDGHLVDDCGRSADTGSGRRRGGKRRGAAAGACAEGYAPVYSEKVEVPMKWKMGSPCGYPGGEECLVQRRRVAESAHRGGRRWRGRLLRAAHVAGEAGLVVALHHAAAGPRADVLAQIRLRVEAELARLRLDVRAVRLNGGEGESCGTLNARCCEIRLRSWQSTLLPAAPTVASACRLRAGVRSRAGACGGLSARACAGGVDRRSRKSHGRRGRYLIARDDVVAGLHRGDALADGLHDAGRLVAQDARKEALRVEACAHPSAHSKP